MINRFLYSQARNQDCRRSIDTHHFQLNRLPFTKIKKVTTIVNTDSQFYSGHTLDVMGIPAIWLYRNHTVDGHRYLKKYTCHIPFILALLL